VIENEKATLRHAERLKDLCSRLGLGLIFKSSYDKANRSSISSYRGPGLKKGLAILAKVKAKFRLPILSDVHCQKEVKAAARVLDVIQIPAFLCRQTDFILACARTRKVVNIKKGQFLAPDDLKNILRKIEGTGNRKIIITERGFSFGYHNLVSDMRALAIMRKFGYPVIFDASHSVQLPGGLGVSSGGEREFVPLLARSAVAAGCAGLFIEVHENPGRALCDGPNMINFPTLERLLRQVIAIDKIVKQLN
jgi:2-dehydro-3-deoxyphosphooctonate aldolase (KDO 8-P synthase)